MTFLRNILFTLILLVGSLTLAEAQRPVVRAELDSAEIFVGSQVGLNLSVLSPKGVDVHLLQLPDSIAEHIEVLRMVKVDTTIQGDLVRYSQRYILTSFDTGLYLLSQIPVALTADEQELYLEDMTLKVINPFQQLEFDEQSGVAKITDVFAAHDAPFQWRELLLYWPWLVGGLLLVALVVIGILLYKKYGKSTDGQVKKKQTPAEPCEVVALRDLERIKNEKLWQHNRVKDYYSELTDTLRRYIGERYEVSALESTSAELLDALRESLKESPEDAKSLEYILSQADFAKFAKMEPLPDENDRAISEAMSFVVRTTERAKAKEEAEKQTSANKEGGTNV